MKCNSTRFTNGCILKFLGFIKHYPACRPAAFKTFKQSQLGLASEGNLRFEQARNSICLHIASEGEISNKSNLVSNIKYRSVKYNKIRWKLFKK